jgi:hypothetical protein
MTPDQAAQDYIASHRTETTAPVTPCAHDWRDDANGQHCAKCGETMQ